MSPGREPLGDLKRPLPNGYHPWESIKGGIIRYNFAAKYVSNKLCLDIACGDGWGSTYLIKGGAKMVVGADVSQKGIGYARARYSQDGLHFLLTDAQQLPFQDESFELVVSIETIEHLEKPRQFLSECYRVLKPQAMLICSTPNKATTSPYTQKPLYSFHAKEFYIDEFRSLVAEEHFQDIAIFGQGFTNKGILWRLNARAGEVGNLIRRFPKGQSIVDFLNRIVLRRRYIKLEELAETGLKGLEDDIGPLPQEGKESRNIILVARR